MLIPARFTVFPPAIVKLVPVILSVWLSVFIDDKSTATDHPFCNATVNVLPTNVAEVSC